MRERTGYVFESNGKWYARVNPTDKDGKRRNIKRTATSKQEAKKILKQLVRQLDSEGLKVIDNLKVTFGDLADYYELHYLVSAKFSDGQKIEGLRSVEIVRAYVNCFRAYFGSRLIRDIDFEELVAFRKSRLATPTYKKQPRKIATVNRELSYLRRMFNIALQNGWITKNPFKCGDSLILLSSEKRRERILSLDEEKRLLEACNTDNRFLLKCLLIMLLDTGARKGETLKLAWHDIDLEARIITFRAMNTKTLRSRKVGITIRLNSLLEYLWEKSDKNLDSEVFSELRNLRSLFSTICQEAGMTQGGIEGLNIHSLRHTAATRLVQGQMSIQMVGRILGHTQVNTTYRYLTATDDTLLKAASILDSFQQQSKE